jgi:diguanylate cyclase (GGDEF)-like protein
MGDLNNSKEILIVEDSATQAEMLRRLLVKEGYEVVVANNGAEGLERLQQQKPSAIISDILMPVMDGYEFCRRVKADENLRNTPVVLLTILSDPQDIVSALECGADYFIVKPYDEKYLITKIKHLVNHKPHRDEGLQKGVEIYFAGWKYVITSGRKQILELLMSSYEDIVQKNRQLLKTQEELLILNEQLEQKITVTIALREELKKLSLTNELTGLYNRRGFIALAQQQIKLADRSRMTHKSRPLLLLFVDLDNLKQINDNFGHKEGDRILIETARILKKTFRDPDIIARIGGDEFAVLALDTSEEKIIRERLQKNIDVYNKQGILSYELSLSIGIACYDPENPCTLDDLLSKADALMYENKLSKKVKKLLL